MSFSSWLKKGAPANVVWVTLIDWPALKKGGGWHIEDGCRATLGQPPKKGGAPAKHGWVTWADWPARKKGGGWRAHVGRRKSSGQPPKTVPFSTCSRSATSCSSVSCSATGEP